MAITFAVMAAIIMNVLDTTIVNVALPNMEGALRANPHQGTWVLTTYLLAMVIVTPLTGLIVERYGQKRAMFWSVAVFVFSSAMCGQAHSLAEMVFWRFLQGGFGAAMVPIGQSVLVASYPPAKRGVAMATLGMGIMLGPIVGPILGGFLTDQLSWRWCFYVNVPVGLLALALIWLHVPEAGRSERPRPIDWMGFALMAIGLGSLQIVLSLGDQDNWFTSHFIVTLTLLATLALLFFTWRSLTVARPLVNLRLLKDRSLALGSAGIGLFGLALYGVMIILPIYLQDHMGYEAVTSGLVMAPQGVGAMFSMWLAGRLLSHGANPRWMIFSGILLGLIGSYYTLNYNLDVSPWWIVFPGLIRGLGLGLISIPIFNLAFATLTKEETAEGSGIFNLMRNLGGSVGIAIIATILSEQTQAGWNQIGGHISSFNTALGQYLSAANLPESARTWATMGHLLGQQAAMRGILDAFTFVFYSFAVMIPMVLLMRSPTKTQARNIRD
ncbi:DHA2 family efflux MFS transporter permease subunit [Acidithiobacillus sp. IBUN Pt1247-S3]|uniref:DHA2 family efflux MFS transporter permease subunit n=1 Tax=Acidithiobacillus sp. IBUN Pt1247-S3 TaxID=3166642 RepID=UPI0034E4A1B7